MTTYNQALKPCPFCGGEPTHSKTMDESLWSHEIVEWRKVECDQCEIGTNFVCDGYEPSEVEAWNARPAPEALGAAKGVTPEMVQKALSAAWNDFISDTGCYPSCFKVKRGMRIEADFERAEWAFLEYITETLNAAIAKDQS